MNINEYFKEIDNSYNELLKVTNELDTAYHPSEEGMFTTIKDKLVSFIKTIDELIYKGVTGLINLIRRTNIVLEDASESYKTISPYIKRLYKYKDKLKDKINKLPTNRLLTIIKKKVPVPVGLKITIPDYIIRLEHLSVAIINYNNIAKMLETRLDNILESDINNVIKQLPSKYEINTLQKQIIIYKKEFEEMFGNTMVDYKPIEKLVNKLILLPDIVNKSFTLGKYYNIEKLQEIDERNEALVVKAKQVINLLKKNPEIVGKQTLNGLADYFKIYAEYVTIVGLSNIAYTQLTDTLYNIAKLIVDGELPGKAKSGY